MSWHNIQGYVFPPFAQMGRCQQQIVRQNVEQLILVARVWPSQPWYPPSSAMHRSPSFVSNVTNTVNEAQSISPLSQPTIGWVETISKC